MRPIYNIPSRHFSQAGVREQLLMSSGFYCSLCEIPLGGEAVVADRVCTSDAMVWYDPPDGSGRFQWYLGQPWAAEQWYNVLLSCPSCRDLRGAFPSNYEALEVLSIQDPGMYASVLASMRGRVPYQALPEDQKRALYQAAASSMLWPDTCMDAQGNVLFQGTVTEQTFSFERSTKSQLDLWNDKLVRLTEDEASTAWAAMPYHGIWIIPHPSLTDIALRDRALSTIEMSALNSINPNRQSDLRVNKRSFAGNNIVQGWDTLNRTLGVALSLFGGRQLPTLLTSPAFLAAAQSIREDVKTFGFWSLWFEYFNDRMQEPGPPNGWLSLTPNQRKLVLYSLFIQYEPDDLFRSGLPRELLNVLPGTNLNQILLFRKEPRR